MGEDFKSLLRAHSIQDVWCCGQRGRGDAPKSAITCCWSINNIFSLFLVHSSLFAIPFWSKTQIWSPFRDSLEPVSWRIFYPQSKIHKVVLDGFPNVCHKWQISRIDIVLEFYWETCLFPLKCLKAQVDLSWYWLALVIIARHAKWVGSKRQMIMFTLWDRPLGTERVHNYKTQ